jgi:hypothetical protein
MTTGRLLQLGAKHGIALCSVRQVIDNFVTGEFVVQNFSDDVGHVAKVLENDGARIIISDIEAVNAAANIAAPVTTIVTTAVAVLEMQPGSSVSDFFWSDNAVNAV